MKFLLVDFLVIHIQHDVSRSVFNVIDYIDFSTGPLQYLSSLEFVPIAKPTNTPSPTSGNTANQPHGSTFVSPNKCYLSKGTNGESSSQGFHSQLFTFVDFGPSANAFLTACGVRQEPTVDELARMLVADPRKFYELAGGYDRCENFPLERLNDSNFFF